MINYKDTPVELLPAPVAIDKAIQKIQQSLAAGLPWLQKSFGRATVQARRPDEKPKGDGKATQGRDIVFPEGYYKREPFNLMPNDNFRAYSFWFARDPLKFLDWEAFELGAPAEQPATVIFWANLEKIDPTKQYNFGEELRFGAAMVLKGCPDFTLQESSIQYDKVFAPFTITETFRQFLKPPYFAFRFDGVLRFDYLNC